MSFRLPLPRHLAALATSLLAACGGGNDTPAPAIQEFGADRSAYHVGESATLRVRYAGGAGRIEPDLGAVAPDARIATGALDHSRSYRLVVEGQGRSVASTISLSVAYRDRHRSIGRLEVAEHNAVALDDGTALVIGGSRAGMSASSHWIERINPVSGTVTHVADMAAGRLGSTVTRLADGRFMVSGGQQSANVAGRMNEIIAVGPDGAVSVSGTGDMSRRRIGHTATLLADGRVLVTGGHTQGEGEPAGISRSAEVWDPASGSFRRLAPSMTAGRVYHSATRLPDGKVLIVGGHSADSEPPLAELFDPATETFAVVASPGFPSRALHAAVALADGDVLIVGGETLGGEALADVLRYRHATRTMQSQPPLLEHRRQPQVVLTADGTLLVFGGVGRQHTALASAERYTPSQGATALAAMADGRFEHSAVLLRGPSAGKVLLVGGWLTGWYNAALAVYE